MLTVNQRQNEVRHAATDTETDTAAATLSHVYMCTCVTLLILHCAADPFPPLYPLLPLLPLLPLPLNI